MFRGMICVKLITLLYKFLLLSLFQILKQSRDEPVGHCISVAFPVLPILAAAAMFITHTAVDQQDGHVNNVEVRKNVAKTTRSTVR